MDETAIKQPDADTLSTHVNTLQALADRNAKAGQHNAARALLGSKAFLQWAGGDTRGAKDTLDAAKTGADPFGGGSVGKATYRLISKGVKPGWAADGKRHFLKDEFEEYAQGAFELGDLTGRKEPHTGLGSWAELQPGPKSILLDEARKRATQFNAYFDQ